MLAAVDRFVAPSACAAGQLVRLGLPRERVEALRALPARRGVRRGTRAPGEGAYALVASRLSPEKGIDDAIARGGRGGRRRCGSPATAPTRDRACEAARSGADVRVPRARPGAGQVRELLDGAAAVLMPSRYHEFSPYSALEAMAQGVPVVATAMGGLPELLGAGPVRAGAATRTPSRRAWPRSGPTLRCARPRARRCCSARGSATPRSATCAS